jgi:hypothetical protein
VKLLALIVTMPLLLPHDVVVIVGKRGSGKSTRAKALVAEQLRGGARVLDFDPNDEGSRHGKKKKHVDLGPLRDRCTVDELLSHPSWLDRPDLSLSVVPASKEPDALAEDLHAVHELVEQTGDMVCVLEEMGLYRDSAAHVLRVWGTQSRHYGESGSPLIAVAQRMALIEKSMRDQCSMVITGNQTDPEDLDAIEKMVRPSLGPEGAAQFVNDVANLKRPGLLEWREGQKAKGGSA